MTQYTQPGARQTTQDLLREALNTVPADFEHDKDSNCDEFRLWYTRWRNRLAELEPYL